MSRDPYTFLNDPLFPRPRTEQYLQSIVGEGDRDNDQH